MQTFEQVQEFLSLFEGNITVAAIPGKGEDAPKMVFGKNEFFYSGDAARLLNKTVTKASHTFRNAAEINELAYKFFHSISHFRNISFLPNESDGIAASIDNDNTFSKSNIITARSFVLDIDNEKLTETATLATLNDFLPPSITIRSSPGKVHAYYLITPSKDLIRYTSLQTKLAKYFNADEAFKDYSHPIRLPGFPSVKKIPHTSEILSMSKIVYDMDSIEERLKEVFTENGGEIDDLTDLTAGQGYIVNPVNVPEGHRHTELLKFTGHISCKYFTYEEILAATIHFALTKFADKTFIQKNIAEIEQAAKYSFANRKLLNPATLIKEMLNRFNKAQVISFVLKDQRAIASWAPKQVFVLEQAQLEAILADEVNHEKEQSLLEYDYAKEYLELYLGLPDYIKSAMKKVVVSLMKCTNRGSFKREVTLHTVLGVVLFRYGQSKGNWYTDDMATPITTNIICIDDSGNGKSVCLNNSEELLHCYKPGVPSVKSYKTTPTLAGVSDAMFVNGGVYYLVKDEIAGFVNKSASSKNTYENLHDFIKERFTGASLDYRSLSLAESIRGNKPVKDIPDLLDPVFSIFGITTFLGYTQMATIESIKDGLQNRCLTLFPVPESVKEEILLDILKTKPCLYKERIEKCVSQREYFKDFALLQDSYLQIDKDELDTKEKIIFKEKQSEEGFSLEEIYASLDSEALNTSGKEVYTVRGRKIISLSKEALEESSKYDDHVSRKRSFYKEKETQKNNGSSISISQSDVTLGLYKRAAEQAKRLAMMMSDGHMVTEQEYLSGKRLTELSISLNSIALFNAVTRQKLEEYVKYDKTSTLDNLVLSLIKEQDKPSVRSIHRSPKNTEGISRYAITRSVNQMYDSGVLRIVGKGKDAYLEIVEI